MIDIRLHVVHVVVVQLRPIWQPTSGTWLLDEGQDMLGYLGRQDYVFHEVHMRMVGLDDALLSNNLRLHLFKVFIMFGLILDIALARWNDDIFGYHVDWERQHQQPKNKHYLNWLVY
jgi:hypothetical protein